MKQRLVGAAVLVALAVIFLPMLVKGPAPDSGVSDVSLRVPDAPDSEFRTVDLPLVTPGKVPVEGVLDAPSGEGGALATVDTTDISGNDDPASSDQATGEPLPPTVAGGDYAVHYGAFATAADARTVLQDLARAGLEGYVEAITLDGKSAHRVRLGPYSSRAGAEVVRLRAAGLREDVTPRVIALDAEKAPAMAAAPAPVPARQEPAKPDVAKPAPAPAPVSTSVPAASAPAATADVGFVVQLGAFSRATDATALRDRLRGKGIVAFTDTVATDKGRLTRVKAGPVVSRAEAERLKARVEAAVGIDGLVRRHP